MAILIRGKDKDKEVKIMQYCNNWFSVELDNKLKIVNPTSLQFTTEEINEIIKSVEENRTGIMINLYEFDIENLRLKKKR